MPAGNALLLVPLLWGVVAVCWSPLLLSERVRALFGRWPTSRLAINYPLLVAGVVVVHVAVFFAGAVPQPSGSLFVLQWAFGSTLLVPLVGWLGVVVGLPRATEADLPEGVWLPLVAGAIWYMVVASVVFALLALILFALFFPG